MKKILTLLKVREDEEGQRSPILKIYILDRSRVKFIVHLLKHNEVLTDIIEGKVLGKIRRRRTKKPDR